MPPKSDAWNFFEKCSQNKGSAKCKLCFKLIKTSGNTSNLKCHLKTHAADTINKSLTVPDHNNSSDQTSNINTNNTTIQNNLDDLCRSEANSTKRQRSIEEVFSGITAYNEGGTKFSTITNAILYMICRDYQPISIVDNDGFKNLINVLSSGRYKIPSRPTITNLLDKKYEAISSIFKKTIQELHHYCLTTDIWTDTMQTRSFLGITMHFEQKSQLKSVTLGVFEMQEKHTSGNIIDELNKIFELWGLHADNVTAVVSDGAKNITKALETRFGSQKYLHCLAHQINLVVQNSVKSVESLAPLLKKIKDIVTWFKHSVNASDELRKCQSSSGYPKKLIQEVSTRWNSMFYMITRFLELSDVINQILYRYPSAPFMVSARELEQLKEIKSLLYPFEAATNEIEGESYVTSSIVIPMVFNLQQQLIQSAAGLKYEISKKLKSALIQECNTRFGLIDQHAVLSISTLLDPRFKKMYFNSTESNNSCTRVIQEVNRILKENAAQYQLDISINESANAETQFNTEPQASLWQHHNNLVRDNMRALVSDNNNELCAELNLYLNSSIISLSENPLVWWARMSTTYPNLKTIAIKYLSVVATSVPSERLFSKAGQTLTQQRNRLKGKRLSNLLFLQSIDKTFWDL